MFLRVRDAMKCAACNFDQVLRYLSLISFSLSPTQLISHAGTLKRTPSAAHAAVRRPPSATVRTQQSGHRVNQLTLEHSQRGHGQGQLAALPDIAAAAAAASSGQRHQRTAGWAKPGQARATAAALAFLALHSVTLGLTQRVGQR